MNVVGRFAPSPSGRMHLGNVLTALLAWLSVRSLGGEMVLRIEDLDTSRCRAECAEQIKADLLWLGLDWDREQPPQRLRTAAYDGIFSSLKSRGLVYPCYCSRGDLLAASAPHQSDGRLIYAGTCRGAAPIANKASAWRLVAPDEEFAFVDGIQGAFSENLARDCGDFILRRGDGVYAYQLAVVADDIAAGVTHVVRGLDLLESTPRQLYLYRLLGGTPPTFFHTPLLMGQDGHRLSKRQRDLDMGALRGRMGAEALVGYLAFLVGLTPQAQDITPKALVETFSWDRVLRGQITVGDL